MNIGGGEAADQLVRMMLSPLCRLSKCITLQPKNLSSTEIP